jgi:Fe-S-cluster containining protein
MKTIISSERCKKCAQCCKNFPYVKLAKNEIDSLERATALPFDEFTYQKDKALEEYFLQFKENGDCFFLSEENGSYLCAVYETRPRICRNYPSMPAQKESCSKNR